MPTHEVAPGPVYIITRTRSCG